MLLSLQLLKLFALLSRYSCTDLLYLSNEALKATKTASRTLEMAGSSSREYCWVCKKKLASMTQKAACPCIRAEGPLLGQYVHGICSFAFGFLLYHQHSLRTQSKHDGFHKTLQVLGVFLLLSVCVLGSLATRKETTHGTQASRGGLLLATPGTLDTATPAPSTADRHAASTPQRNTASYSSSSSSWSSTSAAGLPSPEGLGHHPHCSAPGQSAPQAGGEDGQRN